MSAPAEAISRLASSFSASDVMVEKGRLVMAASLGAAIESLGRHPDFNLIPLEESGSIVGYVERDREEPVELTRHHLVSDSTSILDLIDELEKHEFRFVISGSQICGYLHFSDLNNPIVKLPLYLLFEAVESHLLFQLRYVDIIAVMTEVFSERRVRRLALKAADLAGGDANLGPEALLLFSELLQLATSAKVADLTADDQRLLTRVRNLVAHAGRPLVACHEDVSVLRDVRGLCFSLLNGED